MAPPTGFLVVDHIPGLTIFHDHATGTSEFKEWCERNGWFPVLVDAETALITRNGTQDAVRVILPQPIPREHFVLLLCDDDTRFTMSDRQIDWDDVWSSNQPIGTVLDHSVGRLRSSRRALANALEDLAQAAHRVEDLVAENQRLRACLREAGLDPDAIHDAIAVYEHARQSMFKPLLRGSVGVLLFLFGLVQAMASADQLLDDSEIVRQSVEVATTTVVIIEEAPTYCYVPETVGR